MPRNLTWARATELLDVARHCPECRQRLNAHLFERRPRKKHGDIAGPQLRFVCPWDSYEEILLVDPPPPSDAP